MSIDKSFPLEIGETILRSNLHKLVGGTTQSGMTSSQKGGSFLIFHNPKKGRQFGYDIWEGLQADGTFWYTGQGVEGDQTLTRANKQLLDFAKSGKPIHFFISRGTETTYQGKVDLANGEFVWKEAPDAKGNLRKVIVFKLLPIMENRLLLNISGIDPIVSCHYSELDNNYSRDPLLWKKQDILNIFQSKYENFVGKLIDQSITVHGKKGCLRLDFCDATNKKLYFAINSIADESLAYGVGQIINYLRYLEVVETSYSCNLVLPQSPGSRFLTQLDQKNIGVHILNL